MDGDVPALKSQHGAADRNAKNTSFRQMEERRSVSVSLPASAQQSSLMEQVYRSRHDQLAASVTDHSFTKTWRKSHSQL